MNDEPETSLTLIERVKRKDATAWQLFANLYGPMVFNWIRGIGLNENDAADVCQNVFHTLLKHITGFEHKTPSSRFRGWLRVVTHNEVRRYWRDSQRNPKCMTDPRALDGIEESTFDHFALDDNATRQSDEQALAHRAMEVIRNEFEPQTWTAFWRTVIDGQPATSIADELDMSPGAVRQAKYRVLCRMRELLVDELPEMLDSTEE